MIFVVRTVDWLLPFYLVTRFASANKKTAENYLRLRTIKSIVHWRIIELFVF